MNKNQLEAAWFNNRQASSEVTMLKWELDRNLLQYDERTQELDEGRRWVGVGSDKKKQTFLHAKHVIEEIGQWTSLRGNNAIFDGSNWAWGHDKNQLMCSWWGDEGFDFVDDRFIKKWKANRGLQKQKPLFAYVLYVDFASREDCLRMKEYLRF